MILENYIEGSWKPTTGVEKELFNAVNGELIAKVGNDGADFESILNYSREVGGPPLRKMTFHERGRALKALALYLMERKNDFYKISAATGATKLDSWIDIEGGMGNLFTYASKGRRELPNEPYYVDGKPEVLSKNGTFIASSPSST